MVKMMIVIITVIMGYNRRESKMMLMGISWSWVATDACHVAGRSCLLHGFLLRGLQLV
jgi:hypothetical protein